jgi:hypothetical protein
MLSSKNHFGNSPASVTADKLAIAVGFVEGHGFSRAAEASINVGFSP